MRPSRTLTLSLLAASLAVSGCFLFRPQPATTAGPETAESSAPPPSDAYAGDEQAFADAAPSEHRAPPPAPEKPCMYDAGQGIYRTCYNAFQGKCSHYGPACLPADSCMFNAQEGVYEKCANPFQGKCSHYTTACLPESGCMYNPKEGVYEKCANPFQGKCSHYTTACNP